MPVTALREKYNYYYWKYVEFYQIKSSYKLLALASLVYVLVFMFLHLRSRQLCKQLCRLYIALNDSKATIFMKGVVPWKQCTASSMRYSNDYEIVNSWFIFYSQPNIAMDNWFLQQSLARTAQYTEMCSQSRTKPRSRQQESRSSGMPLTLFSITYRFQNSWRFCLWNGWFKLRLRSNKVS